MRYPGGVVPVTQVQPGEDQYRSSVQDLITQEAKAACKDTVGMPVCVQVVGLPHQDELVMAGMREVEEVFNFHRYPV